VALPTFVAAGAVTGSVASAAIAPPLPAGIQADDILLLVLETMNQAITIANANGGTWAELPASPQGEPGTGDLQATRLTTFWSRYNGTQGDPTTDDSGDHQVGVITAFRGCETSGNPWNVIAGNTVTNPVATVVKAVPGATTTVADCLVVLLVADNVDGTGARHTSWVNADLANILERADNGTADGNGGGVGVATGEKATAGAYGTTTGTISSAARSLGQISLALMPPQGAAAVTRPTPTFLTLGVGM
jgi:hypothetical protein